MATTLTQGNELYIPFRDGKSISNSQNVPRIYQSVSAFERHFPGYHLGTEDVVLQKYVPERHGRWADPCINKYGHPCHHCSECRFKASQKDRNFCPNCGAKMDGGAE